MTYEAIADRKIGHAALRPEICSGIVVQASPLPAGRLRDQERGLLLPRQGVDFSFSCDGLLMWRGAGFGRAESAVELMEAVFPAARGCQGAKLATIPEQISGRSAA